MKYLTTLVLLCAAAVAHADVANEAVRVLPGGKRVVEEPPGPKSLQKLPTPASVWARGAASQTYVIDTNTGLKECGWPWLAQGCRDYVHGADRRQRVWVIKRAGQWMNCPKRDSAVGCSDYYAPAAGAVQD